MDFMQLSALEILPFILFIVVVVTAIAERVNIPYPLLLVVAGLVVGFIPGIPNWHPPSDTVLALFLPPILFAAARNISWQDIRSHFDTIFSLSIVLVILTTLFLAFILDRFIPKMTFSTAMVLGAIISPTDTVAAVAILSKMNVRQHIIRTIEVESLFNDAMGIVLYNAAVFFVFIGKISPLYISWRSVVVGLGGVSVGLVFAFFTRIIIEQFLTESENELPIIMSMILAYVAYLFADRLQLSGVLTVVAAGLYHRKTERAIEARTRLSEKSVWDTLIFFLNGIIFIVIGIQFPSFLKKVSNIPLKDLIYISVLTIVALLALRIIWVFLTFFISHLLRRKQSNGDTEKYVPFRKIIIVSWSGMRGLVPLALALALPTALSSNEPFPNRDVIVFLTIITILFTLLAQGLTLPSLIKWLGAGKDDKKELQQTTYIYQELTKSAIANMAEITKKEAQFSNAAKQLVENYYANRLLHHTIRHEIELKTQEIGREAENLLHLALEGEREKLNLMRKNNEISEEIFIRILHKLDRDEVGFASYK